ncbi:MAG: hypothetical protein AAB727_02595 [Patescibacteria group bacterium]
MDTIIKKEWTLFSLGVFVFLFPFLGFPPAWEDVFLFAAGAAIAGISLSRVVRARMGHAGSGAPHTDEIPH